MKLLPFLLLLLLSCNNYKRNYLFSFEIKENLKSDTVSYHMSLHATDYSFVPDYTRVNLAIEISPMYLPIANTDSLLEVYKIMDAVDYIIEKSSEEEIIILNESHHYPTHRVFANQLLVGLKANGYRYLGIETLTNMRSLNILKYDYVIPLDGYYSIEPTFSNFIREAIRLGFILFPYESQDEDREKGQAKNIVNFLNENDAGKVFIYCGYAHNVEGPMPNWCKSMAGRLEEYYGINPFTINQTYFNHINCDEKKPFVLVDSLEETFAFTNRNDVFVFHPKYHSDEKKCTWKKTGNNNWLEVDFLKDNYTYPIFVKVFYTQEEKDNDAVPYDIIEVISKEDKGWLIVPKTEYIIEIEDFNNRNYAVDL